MKIEMPIYRSYSGFSEVMTVEIVDVAPHITNATFAVGPNCDAPGWRIYNVETGQAAGFANDSPTRSGCIASARRFLLAKSDASCRAAYKKWANHHESVHDQSVLGTES